MSSMPMNTAAGIWRSPVNSPIWDMRSS